MNTYSKLLGLASLALTLSAAPLRAQLGASTLDELARRADTIVRVRVLAVELPDVGESSAVLRTLEVLHGDAPPQTTFEVTEPAGRACGRSLHGLLPGASYVAFLERTAPTASRPEGSVALLGGGGRTLVGIDQGLVEHVRELATASPERRVELLLAALEARSTRLRDDAAIALGASAPLAELSAEQRRTIATAMRSALPRDDHAAFGLLAAVERFGLTDELPTLLDHFVETPNAALAPRLQRTIVTLARRADSAANAEIARALGTPWDESTEREHVLELLEQLPAEVARDGLLQALSAQKATVRRRAGVAWLRAGLAEGELSGRLDAVELRECRACADPAPTFRSLQGMPRR